MPASKAQQKAVSKYMKANYDEIKVRVEKGQKDAIQTHASTRGESTNGFIGRAISETMTRDSGRDTVGKHDGIGTPPETAGKPAEAAQRGGVVPVPSEAVRAAQGGQELAAQAAQEVKKLLDAVKAKAAGIVQNADREAGDIRQTARQEIRAMQAAAEARIKVEEDAAAADRTRAAQELAAAQAAREAAEAGDMPFPADGECLGMIHLPPNTLEAAREAAEAAKEDISAFIRRAVYTQAWKDKKDREKAAASILPAVGSPVPPGQINQAIEKNIAYLCKKLNEGERRASSKGRSKESDFARCILRDLFEAKYSVEEVRTAVERAAQEGYTGSWLGLKDYCKKLFPQREKKKWEA